MISCFEIEVGVKVKVECLTSAFTSSLLILKMIIII